MKKIVKYSKSYKSIFRIKKDFYNNNSANLKKSIKTNKYYTTQKKEKNVKIAIQQNLNIFLSLLV